jgi:radical SAM superfamily enzyme
MKTADLLAILNRCRQLFPGLRRVGLYGSPQSILRKSTEELVLLHEAGLGILYLGIESGSDAVLSLMDKGVSAEAMISAGQRVRQAGITLSAMLILGLGGTALSDEHARESARVCNAIQPDYLSLLTLMVDDEAPLKRLIAAGDFVEPGPHAALMELRALVDGLELERTVLRSNHASNYVSINGRLPKDKARVLLDIDRCLDNGDRSFSTYRRL